MKSFKQFIKEDMNIVSASEKSGFIYVYGRSGILFTIPASGGLLSFTPAFVTVKDGGLILMYNDKGVVVNMIPENEILNEGRVHFPNINGKSVIVFENPNKEQLKTLHSQIIRAHGDEFSMIRTLRSGKNHYAWDAHHAVHHQVAQSLGLPEISSKFDKGWIDTRHLPENDFDLPKIHAKYNDISRAKDSDFDNDSDDSTGIKHLLKKFKEKQGT